MKNKIDNKYVSWALTALSVIGISILFAFLLFRIDEIVAGIGNILKMFTPLIYGIVIAFLLNLLYNYFDRRFIKLLSKKYKDKDKIKKISKIISISVSIIILLICVFLIIYKLIPQLVTSILGIIENWSSNMNSIEAWLENILKSSPALEKTIMDTVNNSSDSILDWLSKTLVPSMSMTNVTTGLTDMYAFLKNFTLGIIFSIYILIDKNKFIAGMKKLTYTIFGISKGNVLLQGARYTHKIFIGFIKGKIFTSFLIGVGCYIGMILFRMPYALLISFIVAVTNIIPFFGPFIGWAPGVILIILTSPIKALYFTILIIVLQQVEGNILTPKIVGNNTGISGFWVLFSIVVFGEMFGFVGMIIGTPIFAVIYHFVSYNHTKYLEKKNLPASNEDYMNLKYIDETTRKPVKQKSSN